MIKRNSKTLNQMYDVVKKIRKRIEEHDVQINLSLIVQREWKYAQITEDNFYQLTVEQRNQEKIQSSRNESPVMILI